MAKKGEKESKLEKFKAEYAKVQKKHSLPSFDELNNFFDIEDLAGRHTEKVLRLIRRRITEKTSSYLRFIEIFLNPAQAPLFYMMLSKNMPEEGRKAINEAYYELGRVEIEHLRMETIDSDEEEARAIKDVYKTWAKMRENLKVLVGIFEKQWKETKSGARDKSYLG